MLLDSYLSLIKKSVGLDPTNKYFYSPYFDSFLILVLFFVLSRLFVLIATKIILRLTKKTKTNVDDLIVVKTNRPISLILLAIGLRLALLPLGVKQPILNIAESVIGSVVVILITYIVIVVVDIFVDNWGMKVATKTKSAFDDELVPVFHRFTRIFLSIIGLLFILTVWGVEIGPLLASLGIAGVAIAFALQSTLGNIFGGVSLIADKSIRVGDVIKIDSETSGTVVDVGLRSTKIRTADNEMVTVPNGKLADSKILNYLHPDPSIRITVDFGVEYGSSTDKVRKIVLEELKKIPVITKKPEPRVVMDEMGDFALKFKALFWVKNFDQKFDMRFLVTEKIYNALAKNNIGIPFPTRTVYIKKGKK